MFTFCVKHDKTTNVRLFVRSLVAHTITPSMCVVHFSMIEFHYMCSEFRRCVNAYARVSKIRSLCFFYVTDNWWPNQSENVFSNWPFWTSIRCAFIVRCFFLVFDCILTVIVAEVLAQKLKRVLLVDHNCRLVHIFLR